MRDSDPEIDTKLPTESMFLFAIHYFTLSPYTVILGSRAPNVVLVEKTYKVSYINPWNFIFR